MLELLRVSNFALIESQDLAPGKGFTAITGETGAGKSVLLGALRCVLGERTGVEVVRHGTNRASIEALFRGPFPKSLQAVLTAQGVAPDDGDEADLLILRREIAAGGGNSRNYINGRSATLSQVREVAGLLVDMHAQHENGRLFHPAEQMALLDSFGDCEDTLEEYRVCWREVAAARARLAELESTQGEAQRRRDFLAFQVEELSKAAPVSGEDENLEAERRRLGSAERLGTAAGEVVDLLLDGERNGASMLELLRQSSKLISEIASLDGGQEPLVAEVDQLRYQLEDLGERVRDYAAAVSGNPQRLQEVEDRLSLLKTLKRKYQAADCAALADQLGVLQADLDQVENIDRVIDEARQTLSAAEAKAVKTAGLLRRLRLEASSEFESLVENEMGDLELPGAKLTVALMPRSNAGGNAGADLQRLLRKGNVPAVEPAALGPDGAEAIEFLVSLNPGSPPLPLRKVASGGEVARIMLAIKCVLAACDEVPTLVFDEIDVGISGQAAARVGEKLDALARHHQLLCITHLPQVAARGTAHVLVEKSVEGDVARTRATVLDPETRILALARMLGGHNPDDEAKRYAARLLAK